MGFVASTDLFERAADAFRTLQTDICAALAAVDGAGKPDPIDPPYGVGGAADFGADAWTRPGGGGGVSRILTEGAVLEKAGVGWSNVEGELPADFAKQLPGEGRAFRACGVSLVIHPRSPMIPTTHANFRFLSKGDAAWFGGGADLTPYYLFREDAEHFHRVLAAACDRHPGVADYDRFKATCDEYFFLPHRGETRGVGGIFFDYLGKDGGLDLEMVFAFVKDAGRAFVDAYVPIVERRKDEPWSDDERTWQLRRRGRYVEFNLLYDRGTVFGLKTAGRTESILMSLPPLVRWDYDVNVAPGSREADLLAHLKPMNWLGRSSTTR
jgi:coproporphyrinogen III oxidase